MIVGVDPGSVHVGVSKWSRRDELLVCLGAVEMTPTEYVRWLTENVDQIDHLLMERYTPNSGFGSAQTGTETQWLIGYSKWLCFLRGVRFQIVERKDRKAARKRARAAGYRFLARGSGDHAADGESVVIAGFKIPSAELLRSQRPS
jgi:hypothetical protein